MDVSVDNSSNVLVPSSAPCFPVPSRSLISIEHPYIIENLDRGIESLGGAAKLQDLIHPELRDDAEARLYLRPGDRWTKPLYSHNEKTHNLVLRVRVPKASKVQNEVVSQRTLAKDTGPPTPAEHEPAALLLQTLRDRSKDCQIHLVGAVKQTHRFRTLTDFVKTSENSPFMQKMNDTILSFDYQKMKQFKLNMSQGGEENTDIIPPPTWSQLEVPFNYSYKQNPAVLTAINGSGEPYTWNSQIRANNRSQVVAADAANIPEGPAPDIPAIFTLDPMLQRLFHLARDVLKERPVVTRRSLPNLVPDNAWRNVSMNHSKTLFRYLGYTFSSGPWKDALIRFGVDPRLDCKYRIYQTLTFVIDKPPSRKGLDTSDPPATSGATEPLPGTESHMFDGSRISHDGKTWQICDITDPVLKDIFATEHLRPSCHLESDGWYHNGTWIKAKTIMKWKIAGILTGDDVLNDQEYARVAEFLPEALIENERLKMADLPPLFTTKEKELASTIRTQWRRAEAGELGSGLVHTDPVLHEVDRESSMIGMVADRAADNAIDTMQVDTDNASD